MPKPSCFAPRPRSPADRGKLRESESPSRLRASAMATLQKPWREKIAAYQLVLTFLFMGKRPGGLGSLRGAGSGGRKARAPPCKGSRRGPEVAGCPRARRGGEERLDGMTPLQKLSDFSFSSFTQALSSPFSSSYSSSRHSGRSLFSTWCGSSWTGTLPSKVSMTGLAPGEQKRWCPQRVFHPSFCPKVEGASSS